MTFIEQHIHGVWVIEPKRFGDMRGYFSEVFKLADFEAHIGHVEFVQDNESFSTRGVLRGLHFQRGEWSQAKLVRVSLGADTGRQLFIPRGFAHGFVVLSDQAQFQYKVDNIYAPQSEATLRFDEPALGIDWRIAPADMILSEKDLRGLSLNEMTPDFLGF